jgi:hypothetical protein
MARSTASGQSGRKLRAVDVALVTASGRRLFGKIRLELGLLTTPRSLGLFAAVQLVPRGGPAPCAEPMELQQCP